MRSLLQQVRFQHIYSALALLTVVSFLWYSNALVTRLAQGEEALVAFYAQSLEFVAGNNNTETEFLFNTVVKRREDETPLIYVPAILTDETSTPIFDNLTLDKDLSPSDRSRRVRRELKRMQDSGAPPIRIEYVPGQYQYVYYRESDVLARLRYYPYVMLAVLTIFVGGAFLNIWVINRNQQNRLWAGMAKETAHQLGTPIMGLLAWIEILSERLHEPENVELLAEMQRDVRNLERITERFSKIGSEPELHLQPLAPILDEAAEYARTRLAGSRHVSVVFSSELPPDLHVPLNGTLFAWVIENLIKNALDAMAGLPERHITLHAAIRNDQVMIDVTDTGKGIPSGKIKDIFKPGFTTKKRGWGLGLSLSRRIIHDYHGGRIFVKRSEVGVGTTFRIVLPLGREYRPTLRPEETTGASLES